MDQIPVKEIETTGEHQLKTGAKIYVRSVQGFFNNLRNVTLWGLMLGYFATIWLDWGDRQAVLFDLPARQFHVFGMTFWPQDFILLSFTLIIAAYGLFTITTLAGRVWCGYTCPQTAWTFVFMWLEEFFEGPRNKRIKSDKGKMTKSLFFRKAGKHISWLAFAFLTGVTFVGYFYPVKELFPDLVSFELNAWATFWILFFTLATYGNAGWLREKVCIYMCPYARFQAVMFDQDTLIVSYDEKRGERGSGRGPRKKDVNPVEANMGDCIDCNLCVQVCPTGIDIRDGLQYQCIGCALCIDACDDVMDKMNYDKGLIRYTTEHALEGNETHILRPKLIGYMATLTLMVGVFIYILFTRSPVEVDVLRDRGPLFVKTSQGLIQNTYTVKVMNKTQGSQRFEISIDGFDHYQLKGKTKFKLRANKTKAVNLRLLVDPVLILEQTNDIKFVVKSLDDESAQTYEETRFLGPVSK